MKKYYFILATFLFLMFPKETFAWTQGELKANNIQFTSGGSGFTTFTSLSRKVYNGLPFTGYNYQSDVDRVQMSIDFQDSSLQNGSMYDFEILINVANLWGINGTSPYVNLGGSVCEVTPIGNYLSLGTKSSYDIDLSYFGPNRPFFYYDFNPNGSGAFGIFPNFNTLTWSSSTVPGNYAWSSVFSAVCKNVTINDKDTKLNIMTATRTANSGDFFYGISTRYYSSQDVQQQLLEESKKQTEETKKQTEIIKDSDTSGSKDSANSFFSGFEDNDYGLSDIIKMPLTFIKGLASSKCSSLHLPLPLVDKTVELPCMTSIYSQYFGSFLTLYQTITTGIIAYWCCVNILKLVQGFKNPDKDEIEVMDL